MFKSCKFALLSALLILGLNASGDLLLRATNGVVGQNSAGVKILNDSEMKKVAGGYYNGSFSASGIVNYLRPGYYHIINSRTSSSYNSGGSLINRPCAYSRWGC